MNTMRQSMRPKHQVLVLKCYPKFQKGVSEVKPNPSELSYLLYYASTRRSKVQKVAAYLEKKSSKDVPKGKLGNVQVTLHIIHALIDKSPRDLPLYAPFVLRIFSQILQAKDLSMVEESLPAFQAFCEYEDTTALAANPELSKQFEDVVRGYATLAETPPVQSKTTMSAPVSIRWKTAGLQAIKSIATSEAIGTDGGRQLRIIIPVILENLYYDGEDRLVTLNQKMQGEKEAAMKRRMSINTVRTAGSTIDTEKAAVTDSAADADRLAEEEAGLIALQSLKQIFIANNRGQIRLATASLLTFLIEKTLPDRPDTAVTSHSTTRPGNWTTTLVEMVTKWTPVQDRFIIMITAVENLVKSPMAEEDLEKQLILATLIEWLLSSSINMIGLSIMDVLLGLIQHILALLQLGGQVNTALPHHEQTGAIDLFNTGEEDASNRSSVIDILNNPGFDDTRPPSLARQQLLNRLRKCVGSLATHVYYSDQIHDIITAILMRLKPSTSTSTAGTVAAIDNPAATAQQISESANFREIPSERNEFFSFGTARVTALNAIKDVLIVANRRGSGSGAGIVGRNRISIRTWEGTQWLLRDEDRRVRRAYVEALMTWLRLEMLKQDFRIMTDPTRIQRRKTIDFNSDKTVSHIGPSNSSASRTTRSKAMKSTFLRLLHLAVYEDAIDSPEDDENILLLHLLLHSLVTKLGVNAVRTGLPMVRRLQEDINASRAVGTPKAKINIGSLVHGYFKTCVEAFDFDTTMVGFEIDNEIARRKKHGLWLRQVQIPPQNLDMIIANISAKPEQISIAKAQKESLRPFDNVKSMIDQIAIAYSTHMASPPSSPPTSPGRMSTIPKVSTPGPNSSVAELPTEFREAMTAEWTKDSCMAAAQRESARSISPNGSKSGTTRSQPNGGAGVGPFLSANGNSRVRDVSPASAAIARGAAEDIKAAPAMAAALQNNKLRRRSSAQASSPGTPVSGSSEHGGNTLRVDDLKRVLAGGAMGDALSTSSRPRSAVRTESPLRQSNTAYQDFGSALRASDGAGRGLGGSAGGSGAAGDRHSLTRRSHRGPSMLSAGSESVVDAEGFESASEGDSEHELPDPQPHPPAAEITEQYAVQLGRRPYEHRPYEQKSRDQPSPADRHATGSTAAQRPPVSPLSERSERESTSRPTTRGSARPRSSSEGSAEDPEANARALKGQLVPEVVRGSIVADEGVPPVPPLPTNLRASNRMSSSLAAGGGGFAASSRVDEQLPPVPAFPNANGHARNVSESLSLTALPPVAGQPETVLEGSDEDGVGVGGPVQSVMERQFGAARRAAVDAPLAGDRVERRDRTMGERRVGRPDGPRLDGPATATAITVVPAAANKVAISAPPTPTANTAAASAAAAAATVSPPRSTAGSHGGESAALGSVTGSLGRRSVKGSLKGADGRLVVQALLGSIEVGDVGGKGIGRPPV